MDKKTRMLLMLIGILSIVVGIYGYISNIDSPMNFSGIFIGLSLIVIIYFNKNESD